jgi:hypothetical protein
VDAEAPPVEWVPGGLDLAPGLIGAGISIAAITAVLFLLALVGIPLLVGPATFARFVVEFVLFLPFFALGSALGFLYFPPSIPKLGISPLGVQLGFPLRTRSIPWTRIAFDGPFLIAFTPHFRVPVRYRLSSWQASRLAAFLGRGHGRRDGRAAVG